MLIERGLIRCDDRIADYIAGFDANAKGQITLSQVLTHQCGFPSTVVPTEAYADHELLRQAVCDFRLE